MMRFIPALAALSAFPTAWEGFHMVLRAVDGLMESLDEEACVALRGGIHPPLTRDPGASQQGHDS